MLIKELTIKNLYGYMNKKVVFKNNISILVGINGSGKTTVLNAINWLLKPSFVDLCLVRFDEISLKLTLNETDYLIKAVQTEHEVKIHCNNLTKKTKLTPIQATLQIHPDKLKKDENVIASLASSYKTLFPEPHEQKTWNFLFNIIPNPIIIGLDRQLYIEDDKELRIQRRSGSVLDQRPKKQIAPLNKVKTVLNNEYNTYRNQVLKQNSLLNEKIMLSSFDQIFTKSKINELVTAQRPAASSIDSLRGKVIKFLEENKKINNNPELKDKITSNSLKKINTYFNNLKTIIKETESASNQRGLLYITNINQFIKINNLILEFTKFENEIKVLYNPLKEFLDVINSFFIDSAKQLYFNKVNSEIEFALLDKKGSEIGNERAVDNLSSGEKQILILLTYLRYNSQNLIIIDEPELSLHPKWQGEFLNAVNKLMNKDAQLIIATHSPEIVGKKSELCTVLLPYNA